MDFTKIDQSSTFSRPSGYYAMACEGGIRHQAPEFGHTVESQIVLNISTTYGKLPGYNTWPGPSRRSDYENE